MMKKKKVRSFTLIELLAVIIILGVIALIATPIILNVVDNAKRKANFLTAQGLLDAAHLYYVDSIMDESKKEKVDNIDDIYNEVTVQGNKPVEGNLYATNKGLTAIAVVIDKVCYIKKFDGQLQETEEECNLGFVGIDNTKPTIEFSYSGEKGNNEWYKGNAYIKAKIIDNESGPSRLKWCMTTEEACEPITEINQIQVSPIIDTDTIGKRICVIGYDVQSNESNKICSDLVKLDKTSPEISGVENIIINKGDSLDLRNGITTTDNLSGIEGEFIVTPDTIDTSIVGTTTVEYKVTDSAGNETIKTRTIEVLGSAPSIEFSSTGTFNSNGWSSSDFYIKANITDHSNKGIKSSKWCITQGESCQPTTVSSNISALVSTESGNNKICVEAIDNNDKVTTLCSNNYKLDKTKPQFSGINDVTIQKNASIDLRSGVTVSDTTSGIDGIFTINPTSVDTSKAGTTNVTYTISDLAGNTQTITRKIIVDALAPTATFTVQGSPINANGWSKNDFYVKVDINDQSGLGIKEAKWCSTQSNTCTPNAIMSGTSMTPQVTIESNNNRICIQATDKNNKTSEVICSDAYKLDKTLPTAGTATFTGTLGSNSWYTSNVTVNTSNGTDSLSGHSGTSSNVTSITSNTSGMTITITTTDLAGNQSTRTYTVKVDKNAPTLTAKTDSVTITQGDSINTSTYFNSPSYSISGGSMSCSPSNTSSMAIGNQTITCTATGGNGLKAITTKMITIRNIKYLYIASQSSGEGYSRIRLYKDNVFQNEFTNAVVTDIGCSNSICYIASKSTGEGYSRVRVYIDGTFQNEFTAGVVSAIGCNSDTCYIASQKSGEGYSRVNVYKNGVYQNEFTAGVVSAIGCNSDTCYIASQKSGEGYSRVNVYKNGVYQNEFTNAVVTNIGCSSNTCYIGSKSTGEGYGRIRIYTDGTFQNEFTAGVVGAIGCNSDTCYIASQKSGEGYSRVNIYKNGIYQNEFTNAVVTNIGCSSNTCYIGSKSTGEGYGRIRVYTDGTFQNEFTTGVVSAIHGNK